MKEKYRGKLQPVLGIIAYALKICFYLVALVSFFL